MTLAYDATGAGQTGGGGGTTSVSYSHTASAGADVFLYILVDRQVTPSSVTYGGSSMTLVGSQNCNNSALGIIYLYHIAGVSSGASTVAASIPSCWWVANSVSYSSVSSVGSLLVAYGSTTSPSSGAITISGSQIAVCGLGDGWSSATSALSSPTGGTNRYLANNASASSCGLLISDSTSTATFGGTLSNSGSAWAAASVVLTGTAAAPRGQSVTPQSINRSSIF